MERKMTKLTAQDIANYFLSLSDEEIGDTISTAIGWIIAYLLDKYGTNSGWYPPHLNNI